jgi:hypothetical protein
MRVVKERDRCTHLICLFIFIYLLFIYVFICVDLYLFIYLFIYVCIYFYFTRPEESYRLCCVIVCDLETWRMRRLKPVSGL